jgi:ribosomal protein S18 acetylase RimI-like enzyme
MATARVFRILEPKHQQGEERMISTVSKQVDSDKAVRVIALAFSADPVVRWAYPDPGDYYTYFPRFIRAFAGGAFEAGSAFVSEGYAGAALWLPPGVHADEEQLDAIVEESIAEELQGPIGEIIEMQTVCHPDEPHWYLPMIGVDPVHQGKGYGSRLLAQALSVVDSEGLPAYLEATTTASRALYERHGFEVVRELAVAGSPPMWPMVRPSSH